MATDFDYGALIERLRLIYEDDHERGCDGRCYACSCGYDEANEATAKEAAEALSTQAARIAELEAETARLREILSFDCTAFPGMEDAAIKWADKISGPRGGKSYHPDPIGILEMCEEIAKAAMEDQSHD